MKILRKFTIDDKLKCIEMVTKMGYQKVSELTGIDRKSLREWNKNKEKLKKFQLKKKNNNKKKNNIKLRIIMSFKKSITPIS